MAIVIRKNGFPITEHDIANLEQSIGYRLPGDYRNFLLAHNGGRPGHYAFRTPHWRQPGFGLNDFLKSGAVFIDSGQEGFAEPTTANRGDRPVRVHDPPPAVSPNVTAGVLLCARRLGAQLELLFPATSGA